MMSKSPTSQQRDVIGGKRTGLRAASSKRNRTGGADPIASGVSTSTDRESANPQSGEPQRVVSLLADADLRPGIAATAYDTAWLASVTDPENGPDPRFPRALQWLVENQLPDGSWGGSVRYQHDRVLCTLAALAPLATFGDSDEHRASTNAGTRYLWKHGHAMASEPTELVAFELLLPEMIRRAQRAGLKVPPHLDIYAAQRAEKMSLIPAGALYSPHVTIVHSLEFLGDRADISGLRAAQGENGAIGNSPAATAFYYSLSGDTEGLAYLESCLSKYGGARAPVLYPCETFELLWAAYHLFLAGVPVCDLITPENKSILSNALVNGGVSLSPSFPIPDADDTAVALMFLHELGEEPDPIVLQSFALPEGNFASFRYERHSSVGVSLHVLHALLRVPGYPNRARTIDRLLDYLAFQQIGGLYWQDKWHISPYYATSHALCILKELPPPQAARMKPLVQQARAWLRQTQNRDGSWGFHERPTAEETAYSLLALAARNKSELTAHDRASCMAAARYLRDAIAVSEDGNTLYPPLWIDKCLYTPSLVVRAVIASALEAYRRTGIEPFDTKE
jgi:hypothetical protein